MFRPAKEVIVTDFGNELILLDPRNGEMFSLNSTGRCVWFALPARSVIDVSAQVAAKFDVPPEAACGDVALLMVALKRAGLIVSDTDELVAEGQFVDTGSEQLQPNK
jgi:hypothetical protein